jgi:hypothetical protein
MVPAIDKRRTGCVTRWRPKPNGKELHAYQHNSGHDRSGGRGPDLVHRTSDGEITGNGKPTQGPAHANSICAFSGLEDGDGAGFPGPGGAPPQNWGHSKEAFGATPAERKASGFQPGDSCNGHSGFLVNPPPETP